MNHSAKDYFPDWYGSAIKASETPEQLLKYRKGIDKILESDSYQFWITGVKVYAGIVKDHEEGYQQFWNLFKEHDNLLPVKCDHLLRFLIGCALAEEIEKGYQQTSAFIALGVLVTSRISKEQILTPLYDIAYKGWIDICEVNRNVELEEIGTQSDVALTKVVVKSVTSGEAPTAASFMEYTKAVEAGINIIVKELKINITKLNSAITQIDDITRNCKIVAEESNMLWYIFTGLSNLAGKKLNEVNAIDLPILVAFDLFGLITQLPGTGKISNLMSKAFSLTSAKSEENVQLSTAINSVCTNIENIDSAIPEINPDLTAICPILTSISMCKNFGMPEWPVVFSAQTKLSAEAVYSASDLCLNLYQELLLNKMYNGESN